MAIIYSYPLKTTVKNSDQFVISVAPTSGVGALETNSITFETLKDSILTGQTSGTVTSVTATSPLTGGTITNTGSIGITQASGSADGYLSSTDWTTFNNKQSTSEKGQANGYAPLNSSTKVDVQYLPDALVGAVIYKGTWDAGTNTPTLPTPAPANQGFYYVVSAPGTYLGITYGVGDWAISNGTAWEKVDNTQSVTSVNGLTGAVSLTTSNINEGTNLYYTEARVNANTNVAANTAKVSFPGFGTTAGTALEGNTVIPAAYTNADVDAHLNTSTASATQVLSWDGTDYDWVTQSGGASGVTQVNSGVGLTGGPIINTGTISLDTAGIGAGTYGSQSNNVKIDNITVDAYGRITALSTGATGSGDGTMSSWSVQDNAGTTTSITEAEVLKFAAGTGITSTLTSVSPPIIEIASTVTDTTYDLGSAQSTNDVDITLTGSDATTDTVKLVAGTNITLADNGSNQVTINSTGGGGSGAYQVLDRTFTGNELVSAFNGNLTDQITLLSVPANNIVIIETFALTVLSSSTGTTNYNSNNPLYIRRDGQVSVSASFNVAPISAADLNVNTDEFLMSNSAIATALGGGINTASWGNTGADLVLGPNSSNAVNITAGDRKVKMSLTYRFVDVS